MKIIFYALGDEGVWIKGWFRSESGELTSEFNPNDSLIQKEWDALQASVNPDAYLRSLPNKYCGSRFWARLQESDQTATKFADTSTDNSSLAGVDGKLLADLIRESIRDGSRQLAGIVRDAVGRRIVQNDSGARNTGET